jgi:hypothetical protein
MCAVRNKVRPADVYWLNCCQILRYVRLRFFLAPPAASLTFTALLVPLNPGIVRHENPFSPRRQAVALTDPSPFLAVKNSASRSLISVAITAGIMSAGTDSLSCIRERSRKCFGASFIITFLQCCCLSGDIRS